MTYDSANMSTDETPMQSHVASPFLMLLFNVLHVLRYRGLRNAFMLF